MADQRRLMARIGLPIGAALALALALAPSEASAAKRKRGSKDDVSTSSSAAVRPHVRVLSEQAEVHSGAGFSYRVLAVTRRDDVLEMVERGKRGGWTRVRLDTGITGWILSEQITIFSEDGDPEDESRMRRFGRKLREKVFGPPSLMTSRFGGTLSAGALGKEGLLLVRPAVLVDPHLAIELYAGPSVGHEVSRGIFGLGANVHLSPHLPFTLFASIGTGAVYTRGKVDALSDAEWSYLLSPGGGLMFMFKRGVTLRFDVRNHLLFRGDRIDPLQEYSGALAFHF
jgi:hypothetical protein